MENKQQPPSPKSPMSQAVTLPFLNLSKSVRLDFPRFKGEDPASWVYKANQYFNFYHTPFNEKLLMASFHMDGDALIWFQDCEETGIFNNWEGFVEALLTRFGMTAYEDPMEALTRLRQTTSVVAYKGQFEALSNRLKSLFDVHKLSCFLSRLRDEIQFPMKILNPRNLNDAFGLAKIQEEFLISSQKNQMSSSFEYSKPSILSRKLEIKLDSRFKFPLQRLSPAQMEERRRKGLCFNYDDKFQLGHQCKSTKLFLLDGLYPFHSPSSNVQLVVLDEIESRVGEKGVAEITLYAFWVVLHLIP